MRIPMKPLAAAIAACAAALACATTLYKLVDKTGKVTYSEEAPKNFDGQVIRLDIDPNANRAELPRSSRDTGMLKQQLEATAEKDREIDGLRTRLEAARKALRDAKDNPGPGDVERVGTKSGFTRAVPTEDYERKVAKLEDDVKKAEEDLKRAGGSP